MSRFKDAYRTSCKTLEGRELVQRRKEEFDWFINIAPDGFEKALGWINEDKKQYGISP